MLKNKEGLWKSVDVWEFKKQSKIFKDMPFFVIENISKGKALVPTSDDKVIFEVTDDCKNIFDCEYLQLWEKGVPDNEGYFTLENGWKSFENITKVLTATSSSSLEIKDSKVRTYKKTTVICGGSIYDKSTIITTGLCCDPIFHVDFDKTRIVAGQIERSHVITGQSKRIKEIILHPDYSMAWNYPFKPAQLINNICLLKLESDLEFNDNVRNIELNHRTGTQLWKLDGNMLINKEGLWTSDDEWSFKTKDDLIYIKNISKTKVLGTVLTSTIGLWTVKVILGDFIKNKTRSTFYTLWKKGEPDAEGYFTLENYAWSIDYGLPMIMTAISSKSLEVKEHDYDLTNSKCTISGWGGLYDWSLNRWLVSLYLSFFYSI